MRFDGKVALVSGTGSGIGRAPAGVEAMIGGAVRAFGGLDILHNNAFGQPALPPGWRRLAFIGDVDEAGSRRRRPR
jgi:NAD(P)-dependent dehydrogenase (short-subunit alcohol dehydrogenase family)